MKSKNNKKPTIMELKNVCSNLIQRVEMLNNLVFSLDSLLGSYINFNKDEDKFKEFLNKIMEERKNESGKQNSGKSDEGNRETKVRNIKSGKPDSK